MKKVLCWICGNPVTQSSVGVPREGAFHLEVRIVTVKRPYSRNYKSKPVRICHTCSVEKVGMSHDGKNLNPDPEDPRSRY